MKVAELLDQRSANWRELESLCDRLRSWGARDVTPAERLRFAALYRAACADLALADAAQLPPHAVEYLHRLVGRAHNQLYRSRRFALAQWSRIVLIDTPRQIFHDSCVQIACGLFWGVFLVSAWLAYEQQVWPDYSAHILSERALQQLETDFAQPASGRDAETNIWMAGYYIRHNTTIGLRCFAGGLLVLPGLLVTTFNAAYLGASFGHMARPEITAGENFFQFVTAHGSCELTAIVLSAAAGLRLGFGWIDTQGRSRLVSLRQAGRRAMPIMGVAIVLFLAAALIEGFLSPSAAPYSVKAGVALACSTGLTFYFVVLGVFRSPRHAAG